MTGKKIETEKVEPFTDSYLMWLRSMSGAIASLEDLPEDWRRAYLALKDSAELVWSMQRRWLK